LLPNVLKVLLALVVVVAAIFDLRWKRVPNSLTLPGLLLGISLNTIFFQREGLWSSLEGLGLAFLIYFPLFLLRAMGGGDVKLMAAVGAIAGPGNWLRIFFFTLLFGALAAIILMFAKRRVRRTLENMWLILASLGSGQAPYARNPELDVRSEQSVRLPHAVTIACGAIAFLVGQAAGILR
jgi:prepilin peptidase CpaA